MGVFGSRWQASWQGRMLVVTRNEWTKGFKLLCDDEEIASKSMSLAGVGELTGEIMHEGSRIPVRVVVESTCQIFIDGAPVEIQTI
jgi:hypothetical protein